MIYLLGKNVIPTRRRFALNVCLVAEEYPPDTGWGGIGTYHYTLARGLVDLGCSVVIVAPRNRWTHELGRHPLDILSCRIIGNLSW